MLSKHTLYETVAFVQDGHVVDIKSLSDCIVRDLDLSPL